MVTIRNFRRVAFAALLAAVGSASVAHADVRFHNLSGRAIHFSVSCDGYGEDDWTIGPNGTKDLYCNNGSSAARVIIRTTHGDHDEVVHMDVFDGHAYDLGYDRDGDVNIWRI